MFRSSHTARAALRVVATLTLATLAACADQLPQTHGGTGAQRSVTDPFDPNTPPDSTGQAGCSYSGVPAFIEINTSNLTDLTVTKPSPTTVRATVKDAAFCPDVNDVSKVQWSVASSPTDAATFSVPAGSPSSVVTVIGARPGSAVLRASSGNASATFVVNIHAARIVITPATLAIGVGQAQTISYQAFDHTGAQMFPNSFENRAWIFSSDKTSVLTVDGSGILHGLANGIAHVTATMAAGSATATVTVGDPNGVESVTISPVNPTMPAESTLQLSAVVRKVGGAVITGRPITWTSSEPNLVFVDSNGLLTSNARYPGFLSTAVIRATVDGVVGSTTVTVQIGGGCNDCGV
ncbi:MAG TPA: hypothetical protein VFE05_05595 [Longimicrobiaceae bacterium]|jgi:hypothetical protein|nr:hypothetical protein [Longimicrobiaceae bacterium]